MGYASFFVFTRTILLLNVCLGVSWLIFVIIPMAIHTKYDRDFNAFHIQNLFDGKVCMLIAHAVDAHKHLNKWYVETTLSDQHLIAQI